MPNILSYLKIKFLRMNVKKLFPICFFLTTSLLLVTISAQAQDKSATAKLPRPTYKTAIGVKVVPFAVTFKTFVGRRNRAFELLGDFNDGFRLTALYEFHGDLTSTGNLKWYIGGGAHGGYYDKGEVDGIMFGIDAVAGLDYKFAHLPINLSLDWQPAFEFITPGTEFQGGRGGIAVRFAF
jgi:hypothetical protein